MKFWSFLFLMFFSPSVRERGGSNGNNLSLFSGKVQLILPNNLKILSEDELIAEFPVRNQRPNYVFEDKGSNTKFSINYGSTSALDKDLPQIKAYFEKGYRNSVKTFISSDLKIINHKQFIIMKFELISPLGNGEIFNYLIITTASGKLFMADYSFPNEQRSNQERKALEILNSMIVKH